MAAIDDLYIRILADGSQLGPGLNQAQGKLDGFGRGITRIGGMLAGAFSVVAIGNFVKASVTAYEDSAKASAKVAQSIKITNGIAGLSFNELADAAAEFQRSTLFEDDTIMNDVTAQLLTFTNIAGTNFKRAQVAALDLATVLGSDLKGQTNQLGKALENPLLGITALQRAGVTFTDKQKAVIKSFVDTNQLGKAQAIILDEIAAKYGGQAVEAAKASTGITQLANSVGNLMENMGGAIVNGETFKGTIKDLGTLSEVMGSTEYTGMEKFLALFDPWADKNLEYRKILAETAKAKAHIAQMDKDKAAGGKGPAPIAVVKETTYADLKAQLKDLQDSQESATEKTIGGINQEIEAVKLKIKAWEDSGKAVINYKGTIKGLQMELDVLNNKRDTITGAANVAAVNEQIRKKEEEIEVLKNATTAWVAYGAAMSQSMTAMVAKSSLLDVPKAKLASNAAFADAAMKKAEAEASRVQALNESINGAISGGLASMIETMAGAAGSGANIGQALLGSFGGLLTSLGGMLIKMGVGLLAAKLALKTLNPFAAIAAGAVLVAVGSTFSSGASSLAGGGSGSTGSSGGYGSSENSVFDTRRAQTSTMQEIKLRVEGRDLVGSINANKLFYGRKG